MAQEIKPRLLLAKDLQEISEDPSLYSLRPAPIPFLAQRVARALPHSTLVDWWGSHAIYYPPRSMLSVIQRMTRNINPCFLLSDDLQGFSQNPKWCALRPALIPFLAERIARALPSSALVDWWSSHAVYYPTSSTSGNARSVCKDMPISARPKTVTHEED